MHQPLLHHDATLGFTLVHAGLAPSWDLITAKILAKDPGQDLAIIKMESNEKFPVTEILTKEILSLPIYPELSESQIEYISENINKF